MVEVQRATWELSNEGGRWIGVGTALRGTGLGDTNVVTLRGEDGYAGLSAHVIIEFGLAGGGRLRGAIFPGEMPPQP